MLKNEILRYTTKKGDNIMIRVGICDDDFAFGCQIEGYLEKFAQQNNIGIETKVFLSGEECLNYLIQEPTLDILFLDIIFGNKINGVTIGQWIRSKLENEITQIVYISAKEEYAMQLFQNRPLDFLLKPIEYEQIEKIMDNYKHLFFDQKNFFEYQIERAFYRIVDNEIIYFQCSGKKIKLVTTRAEKEYYGKMSDVKLQLNPEIFWSIHKSYIVNINYVSHFLSDSVLLLTGDLLPISRSYQKDIHQKFLQMNMKRRWYK